MSAPRALERVRPAKPCAYGSGHKGRARWWLRLLGAVTTVAIGALAIPSPAAAQLPEQYWFDKLSLDKAWSVSKGAGVTVAVVDSGVDAALGDLGGQVLPGVNLSGSSAKDGRSDPGSGCDQYGGCLSHGTNMALVIAGTGNGLGFTGVAPQAKILPVKISARDGADFTERDVADGIRWAVDHGADIVNVSLDSPVSCDPDEGAAVKYAYQHDVPVVASTGNVGQAVGSPANCPGAIAVGGIDAQFRPWRLTNYGPQTDFVGAADNLPQESNSGTKITGGSGTSAATAIVAATFALIKAHFPDYTQRELLVRATNNVHNGTGKFGVRIDDKLGYGEILPYFAMTFHLAPNAPNPIYDAWEKALGPPTGAGSSPPPSSSIPPSSGPASTSAPEGPTHGGITVAGKSEDSGSSAGVIIGVVVAVLVVAGVAGFFVVRSRRGASHS